MSRLSTIYLRGRSGREYCFQVWPAGTRFKSMGAVYLLSKRTFDNPNFPSFASQEFLGIGVAEDISTIADGNGIGSAADCICVLPLPQSEDRASIEQDLIDANLGGWRPLVRFSTGV